MGKNCLFSPMLLVLFSLLAANPVLAAKSDIQFFHPEVARYTGVILQQGRVELDQDFNEDVELEIRARDQGVADEIFAKKLTADSCQWIFLGTLNNSGHWEKNIFHVPQELYPAVQEGLRVFIDINATDSTPTYLEYSKVSVAPLPGTLLLLATGLAGMARRRSKFDKQDIS